MRPAVLIAGGITLWNVKSVAGILCHKSGDSLFALSTVPILTLPHPATANFVGRLKRESLTTNRLARLAHPGAGRNLGKEE